MTWSDEGKYTVSSLAQRIKAHLWISVQDEGNLIDLSAEQPCLSPSQWRKAPSCRLVKPSGRSQCPSSSMLTVMSVSYNC